VNLLRSLTIRSPRAQRSQGYATARSLLHDVAEQFEVEVRIPDHLTPPEQWKFLRQVTSLAHVMSPE
jgi:hypothetical protein